MSVAGGTRLAKVHVLDMRATRIAGNALAEYLGCLFNPALHCVIALIISDSTVYGDRPSLICEKACVCIEQHSRLWLQPQCFHITSKSAVHIELGHTASCLRCVA